MVVGGAVGAGGAGAGCMSDVSDVGIMMMAKYMKQELTSDAEEEGLVPNSSGRFNGAFSMRKVPSLSDLSDPESSLGKSIIHIMLNIYVILFRYVKVVIFNISI